MRELGLALGLVMALLASGCGRTQLGPGGTGPASTSGTGTSTTGPWTTGPSTTGPWTTTGPSTTTGPWTTTGPATATWGDSGWGDSGWGDSGWGDSGWSTSTGGWTCDDGVQDGDETDVDCGGELCPPCKTGKQCVVPSDCASDECTDGVCGCGAWSHAVGSPADDDLVEVLASPTGDVFGVGHTDGEFPSQNAAGGTDLILARRLAGTSTLVVYQLGSSGDDLGAAISPGPTPNSTLYLAASTDGKFAGDPALGGMDALLVRVATSGSQVWARQIGTTLSDRAADVATAPNGAAIVVGSWHDDLGGQSHPTKSAAFVARVSPDGALTWQHQPNSPEADRATGVAVAPNGDVLVVGTTEGQLGGDPAAGLQDLFVIRYRPDGTLLWQRQLGTPSWDTASAVCVGAQGEIHVLAGSSSGLLGAPNVGGRDVFVVRLTPGGDVDWVEGLGTSSNDYGADIAPHPDGGVVLVGRTIKSLDGQPTFGSWDVFAARYDDAGTHLWTRQLGTASDDQGTGIAAHADGSVTLSARSFGALGGPNAGGRDGALLHLCE